MQKYEKIFLKKKTAADSKLTYFWTLKNNDWTNHGLAFAVRPLGSYNCSKCFVYG